MSTRVPRWARAAVVLLFTGAIVAGVPTIRESMLRAAGWALVFDAPVERVDVVIVSVDAGGAGVLEAADLVHRGIAARVAVFAAPPDAADLEFLRRGMPYEEGAAISARRLTSLGVTTILPIPRVSGTEAQGRVLPVWCRHNGFRSVVVVSLADHSRRLHRVLQRAMSGHPTKVIIRAARYSDFDPDHWWETRRDIRTGIGELQKLFFDIVRHPFSW